MAEYRTEIFSDRLKQLRKKKKLSQEKLSEFLGYYPNYIGKLETGVHAPSADVLLKLSEYFNVSIDYLLGNEHTATDKLQSTILGLSNEQQQAVTAFIQYLIGNDKV